MQPEVDGGRYPAKRVLGDDVVVEADVSADGHDLADLSDEYPLPATGSPRALG